MPMVRHAAGVDDARNSRRAGGIQDVAGSLDIGAIELRRIARSQPIVRRDVKQSRTIFERAFERARVREIALRNLHRERLEIAAIRAAAHQDSDLPSGALKALATAAPTKPVAPVTSALMRRGRRDRRQRTGGCPISVRETNQGGEIQRRRGEAADEMPDVY